MANEIVDLILRLNIALGVAIIVVLALRTHVRLWFGARVAYALWLLPVVAVAACFVPGRVVHVILDGPIVSAGAPAPAEQPWLLWAWAAGAMVSLAVLALRQVRFTRALGQLSPREDLGAKVKSAESAAHGPAVIGVLAPVIVTPCDFEQRFDAEERAIVLAHERAHLAHGDPWINAAVLAVQCLAWFNPFAHIGARALRLDQELACDAAVLAQGENVRRRYAEAMLKSHLAAAAPLGCAWPASDISALKERISMLKRNLPSKNQTLVGVSAIALVTAAAAAAAWAAQPARIVTTFSLAEESAVSDPDAIAMVADEDMLSGLDALENIAYFDEPDGLDELDALAEDGELEGRRIYFNGRLVEGRDLTPEEREELRQSLRDARAAIAEARTAAREAVRVARVSGLSEEERAQIHAEVAQARIVANEAVRVRGLSAEEAAEIREAVREAQAEIAAGRVERAQAVAEAQAAVREVQIELARERRDYARETRDALRGARDDLRREAEAARARGDLDEQRELERAARALEHAEEAQDH